MKQKNNNTNIMDDRQTQINDKSLAFAGIFTLICLIIATIVRVVRTDNIGWEFFAALGYCVVFIICNRIYGNIEQPKDIFGRLLPTGNSKNEKNARKRDYALGSLLLAAFYTVLDIIFFTSGEEAVADFEFTEKLFPGLSNIGVIAATAVSSFVLSFIIFYIVDCLIGEKIKVRRYNKMIAELNEEDDEIIDNL